MTRPRHQHGYIVITSVIILSVVLLLLAQTLSGSGYFQRWGAAEFEIKERSYALAQSCIDKAIYGLSNDLDYVGNETVRIDKYQCIISPITTVGENSTILTQATVGSSTTKLKMVVDLYLDVVSFEEQ